MPSFARRTGTRRAVWPWVISGVLVVGLGIGGVLGWPQISSFARSLLTPATPSVSASPTPTPTPVPATPSPILGGLPAVPAPNALAARLDPLDRTGIASVGAVVLDGATGTALYSNGDAPMIPASTLKLVTSLVTLETVGPETRFATRVVDAGGGHLVLVGGGDPFLTSAANPAYPADASTEALAAATATALKGIGATTISLGYDASLFAGPAWNPAWPQGYWPEVTPVSALMVDHGIDGNGKRQPDPAAMAAQAFAAQLGAQGIAVSAVAPDQAPAGAGEVARVESMPVRLMVQQTIEYSDNDAAEALFRHIALATGRPGSSDEAAAAVQAHLAARGLWQDGDAVVDGSGLARGNQMRPSQLATIVAQALASDTLRPLVDGLPVAGATGTLRTRFASDQTMPGRGLVRAKTGSLNEVSTLAGYVVTIDGSVLPFAVMANGVDPKTDVHGFLDTFTAALAGCGCRA